MNKIYLFFLFVFLFSSCNGQDTTKINYSNLIEDPISNIVSVSLKDISGNIWFAASNRGVYRYDGKSFTNFTEKDGLNGNDVSCIYQDEKGKLWFGTEVGICYYDGKIFTNFSIAESDTSNSGSLKTSYY